MVAPQQATPWKRMVAAIIDSIIAAIPAAIIGVPISLINAGLGSATMSIIVILVFGLRDALPISALEGASIGKKLFGIKALRSDGSPCDFEASFKRNAPLMVYSIVAVFTGLITMIGLGFIAWILNILASLVAFVVLIVETVKIFQDERGLRIGDLFASTFVYEPEMVVKSPIQDPPQPPNQDYNPPPPPPM